MSISDGIAVLGSVPGILALIAWAVGYGKLQQRLTNVEEDVRKLSDLTEQVTRIDERTKHTDESIKEVKSTLNRLSGHIFDGALDAIRNVQRDAAAR